MYNICIFYNDNMNTDNLIKLENGEFVCVECEHAVKPLTNTAEGMVEADLDNVKKQLVDFPNKVIYAVCPVCGMEYRFRHIDDSLMLEESDEEK